MTAIASTLDPRAKDVFTLDFTAQLNPGETLASIVGIAVAAVRGTDPNAGAFVATTPAPAINTAPVTVNSSTVSGVLQPSVTVATGCCIQGAMGGGLDGTWYEIVGIAQSTNAQRVLTCKLIVPVSAS